MQSLLKLSSGIDAFTRWTGKRLAWLILLAVVVFVKWSLRGRAELRTPTEHELDSVADPIARIGARHIPIELAPKIVKDLMDEVHRVDESHVAILPVRAGRLLRISRPRGRPGRRRRSA